MTTVVDRRLTAALRVVEVTMPVNYRVAGIGQQSFDKGVDDHTGKGLPTR